MLTFLIGNDRVQLSAHVLKRISAAAGNGVEDQILIVPEQFSHEAERQLCKAGGVSISRFAEVLSMSRLSDRVASVCGGAARNYLDKGGQLLAMASAAEQVSSKIKLYASVLRKPEFLASMVAMIEEFRGYCLEPQALIDAAGWSEGMFAQKLQELGYLYEAYLSVCANGKSDPADKLFRLAEALEESDWADSRIFYVDGYTDFTRAELRVLEALLKHDNEIYVTLMVPKSGMQLAALEQDTIRELKLRAAKWNVPIKTQKLSCVSERNHEIEALLEGMFSAEELKAKPASAVQLRSYASVEAECRAVTYQIKGLLANGVRCRDISVASTTPGLYEAPLAAAFSAAELPYYIAGEKNIMAEPIIGAVLHALSAAVGALDYEDVALYLKSGLPTLERDRCDRLDNYAYRWNLHGSKWDKALENHPRGFGLPWEETDRCLLRQLDADRQTVMEPLLTLRKRLFATVRTGMMAKAFYEFLEELKLRQRLEREAEIQQEKGNGRLAQELSQLFELIVQSLEQAWSVIGDTTRSPDDFYQLYQMLLSQYDVGTIPAGLDQIQISDLPDLRYRSTEYLFVLGASDGTFPSYRGGEGILTEEERHQLIQHGIAVAVGGTEQTEREITWIHSALSAANRFLSISYAGEQPAWLFRRAVSLYPGAYAAETRVPFSDLDSYAAWRVRTGSGDDDDTPALKAMEDRLRSMREYQFTPLKEATVQRLYGHKIRLSASKIDKYAACRFAFFLTYGLRAQPLKQAKLDAPAFGTFVHEVLEHTVQKVREKGGFPKISEHEILDIATGEIDLYAKKMFPEQTLRNTYLFNRSKDEIMAVVQDLWQELRHSKFQPVACELKFADDGVLPAVEIHGEKAACQISGSVDRVDLYEENGRTYARVVDYKTGTKAFDYTDILNGAGLQMLIYLFALRQYGGAYLEYGELEPAGVLYMPAKQQYLLTDAMPDETVIEKAHQKAKKRQGLIREDDSLLAAMEEDPEQPVYMPYDVKKSGKQGDLADRRQMRLLERHVLRSVAQMADGILSGDVVPNPIIRGAVSSCTYCDYQTVCHQDLGTQKVREMAKTSASVFWEKLEEEEAHGRN